MKVILYLNFFILSIVVSVDGLGVGLAYGLRSFYISFSRIFIIMICSGGAILFSMIVGEKAIFFFPENTEDYIGGGILICIGVYSLGNIMISSKKVSNIDKINHPLISKPNNNSKKSFNSLSIKETSFLGLALAVDAFGVGFSASIIGLPIIITMITIAIMSGALLYIGLKIGLFYSEFYYVKRLKFFPSILIILLGLLNIL